VALLTNDDYGGDLFQLIANLQLDTVKNVNLDFGYNRYLVETLPTARLCG
jgi:hypothetical protein